MSPFTRRAVGEGTRPKGADRSRAGGYPMNTFAVYPGTFDPVTYGHIDIARRAGVLFDRVILAVAHNPEKKTLFSVEERVAMLKDAVSDIDRVEVDEFGDLLIDYVRRRQAQVIIRGLRAVSDFEFELQMALTNRKLADDIQTVFMMPSEAYSYLSSRIIKEVVRLGANVEAFVPPNVQECLEKRLRPEGGKC